MVHLSSLGAILQVLEHVRLPLLSPKFLVGTVGSDLLIKSDEVNSFMGSYIFSFILCRFNGKIYCKELWKNILKVGGKSLTSIHCFILSCQACRDLVDEAKNYLLLPQERPLMQGPRTRPRKPIKTGEVLFAG